jgi:glycosyltransferase involved in cell wall biosynthesis
MSQLQVLVATMHQADCSLVEKMNIACDAVIANQADRNEILVTEKVKMITTTTRGVGLNRNIALLASDAELLLFADDDMVYYDGMAESVTQAFRDNPQADVLVFGIDITRNGEITERRHLKSRRLHVWNSMKFGAVRIAIRRSALLRENLTFNQNFGGGCAFSSGEDSLFLKACFDAGLSVYAHPCVLGTCAKDTSSWFVGYNEKYFYDRGVLMRYLFPRYPRLMSLYFGVRFKRETTVGALQRVKLMLSGVRGGKNLTPYTNAL